MWEAISKVLTSSNGFLISLLLLVLVVIAVVAVRQGVIKIKTDHVKIGTDSQELERRIIREQISWVHEYIMSLESKLNVDKAEYNGYFTKYILESVYDEVIKWIAFNHLNTDQEYVSIKQELVCAIVYGQDVRPEFKTPEFKERMCKWTKEVIEMLVKIREVYKKQVKRLGC